MDSEARKKVFEYLDRLEIGFECHEHPAVSTVEAAMQYCKGMGDVTHCKNLFLRNHKGDRHYLVILEWSKKLDIRSLGQKTGQGRLSFASPERMKTVLGLSPGSVSLFGVINDTGHAVHLILDKELYSVRKLSFHPNDNTASLVISNSGFRRFLEHCGNSYEFVELL